MRIEENGAFGYGRGKEEVSRIHGKELKCLDCSDRQQETLSEGQLRLFEWIQILIETSSPDHSMPNHPLAILGAYE